MEFNDLRFPWSRHQKRRKLTLQYLRGYMSIGSRAMRIPTTRRKWVLFKSTKLCSTGKAITICNRNLCTSQSRSWPRRCLIQMLSKGCRVLRGRCLWRNHRRRMMRTPMMRRRVRISERMMKITRRITCSSSEAIVETVNKGTFGLRISHRFWRSCKIELIGIIMRHFCCKEKMRERFATEWTFVKILIQNRIWGANKVSRGCHQKIWRANSRLIKGKKQSLRIVSKNIK